MLKLVVLPCFDLYRSNSFHVWERFASGTEYEAEIIMLL